MAKRFEEPDLILVCPFCMEEKTGRELGCCGESSAHFELVEAEESDYEVYKREAPR